MMRRFLSQSLVRTLSRPFSTKADFALAKHSSPILSRDPTVPVLVAVLDGVGLGNKGDFDAVYLAKTPVLDSLMADSERFTTLRAHGSAVGLPSEDDMGNSEVGHNALGCGRVVKQGASLVDAAIADGSIFSGAGFKYLQEAWNQGGTFHMIGLLSDGGVHSRYDQMLAVARGAAQRGCARLRMHVLLDGRDVPDGTSLQFVQQLEADLKSINEEFGTDARIASGGGRMGVTMDRYEADWSIVERGWQAHALGQAEAVFSSGLEAVSSLRQAPDVSDQYLPPFVIHEDGEPVGAVRAGDAALFFNFRGDRAIEISRAFEDQDFDKFDRGAFQPGSVRYAGMMSYDGDLGIPQNYLVEPPVIDRTSGEFLAHNGVRTFAISETQKFGHVTYFWNGNRSEMFDSSLETYVEIESDRCEFNQAPKMKAPEIANAAVQAILSGDYDMIRLNFANGDMVGHTGDLKASIEAMEEVDSCLGQVLEAIEQRQGRFLVTADHGNADEMVQRDKKGAPMTNSDGEVLPLTSHTLAPVPVVVGGPGLATKVKVRPVQDAGLANVTATFMNLLGFEAPADYEPSLLHVEA